MVSLDPGQHDSSSFQKQNLEAEKDQFSKSSRSQKKSQARKNIDGQKNQNRKSDLTESKDSSPIFSPSRDDLSEEDNDQIHTPSNFVIPDHIHLYGHYNSSASVVTSEKQDQYTQEERPSAVPETSVTVYYVSKLFLNFNYPPILFMAGLDGGSHLGVGDHRRTPRQPKGSRRLKKVQFFLTLFKRPLTPPSPFI